MEFAEVDIGPLHLVRNRARRGRAAGTRDWVPAAKGALQLCLLVQFEGCCTIEQGDRRQRLTPESWSLWDAPGPQRIRCEGRFDQVALLFPRACLGAERPLAALDGVPRGGHRGADRLVIDSVRALACGTAALSTADIDGLADATLRLLRFSLALPRVRRHSSRTSLSEQ